MKRSHYTGCCLVILPPGSLYIRVDELCKIQFIFLMTWNNFLPEISIKNLWFPEFFVWKFLFELLELAKIDLARNVRSNIIVAKQKIFVAKRPFDPRYYTVDWCGTRDHFLVCNQPFVQLMLLPNLTLFDRMGNDSWWDVNSTTNYKFAKLSPHPICFVYKS